MTLKHLRYVREKEGRSYISTHNASDDVIVYKIMTLLVAAGVTPLTGRTDIYRAMSHEQKRLENNSLLKVCMNKIYK